MQLFLYVRSDSLHRQRLVDAVQGALPQQHLQVFRDRSGFKEQLCTLVDPESIAVILARDQEDLLGFQDLRSLLTELFVVLIVSDKRKKTIRLAHLLLPRFICQAEDDYGDLQKVLQKIACTPH